MAWTYAGDLYVVQTLTWILVPAGHLLGTSTIAVFGVSPSVLQNAGGIWLLCQLWYTCKVMGWLGSPLEWLGVEPLVLQVKRRQFETFDSGASLDEVFQICPTRRWSKHSPRICWRYHISWLAFEQLGVPPDELKEVGRVRKVWDSLLKLLPYWPEVTNG